LFLGSRNTTIVSLSDIQDARARIDGITVRTPLLTVEHDGRTLYLKPENLQPNWRVQVAWAYNKIASFD